MATRNARLKLLQRIGLGLLLLSFLCAFAHVFVETTAPAAPSQPMVRTAAPASGTSSAWLSVVAGGFGASLVWVVSTFFGTPLRKFFDLRGDIIRQLTNFANVRAACKEDRVDGGLKPVEGFTPEDAAKLNQAQSALRDLASQLRAFSENEPFAMVVIRLLRYNPLVASADMIGLSNAYGTYGGDKAHFRQALKKSLRLKS
jgi:hypothetical protein